MQSILGEKKRSLLHHCIVSFIMPSWILL